MRVIAMCGFASLASCLLSGTASAQAARLAVSARTTSVELVGFDDRRQDAERTVLTVEERLPGTGDTVRLEVAFLRLPARQASARSPIVFLMGGPGVPAGIIGRIPPYWSLFEHLREVADVILLDQRGVGMSSPVIDCPPGQAPARDFLASNAHLREALRTTYVPCATLWRDRGFPPDLFTVGEIARDIEAVREQLGVSRVSLLGFSYGTRLALEYVRLFPDRVDQVALQGVLGFNDVARLPSELDAVLHRVHEAAGRDTVARGLVISLEDDLSALFRSLEKIPVEVTVVSEPGDSVRLTVGSDGLRALVSGGIADPALPALVASVRSGDPRLLAARVGSIYRDLANGGGSLFGRAVYCSAPASAQREREAQADAAGSIIGPVFDNIPATAEFCRDAGITPGARAEAPEHVLDRPALMITGTLDDRAPLANMERAARFFMAPQLVRVENGGHELLPVEAVSRLVIEFFSTGRVERTELTLPAPRFLTLEEALRPVRRR